MSDMKLRDPDGWYWRDAKHELPEDENWVLVIQGGFSNNTAALDLSCYSLERGSWLCETDRLELRRDVDRVLGKDTKLCLVSDEGQGMEITHPVLYWLPLANLPQVPSGCPDMEWINDICFSYETYGELWWQASDEAE